MSIKTENVFSVIREINEILSLTNEPDKLVTTALDALSQIMDIECCWIQTISDRKNQKLSLAANRGFSDGMKAEIASMDLQHDFTSQIIGMGKKITIPDLNNDGLYGLDTFRTCGYRWLVAVPLMTYRVYGLLGTASKNRKLLDKHTTELIMVIGGLVANALSKAHFAAIAVQCSKPPDTTVFKPEKAPPFPGTTIETAPDIPAAKVTHESVPAALHANPAPTSPPPEISEVIVVEKKARPEKPAIILAETQAPPEEPLVINGVKKTPAEKASPGSSSPKAIDPAFHSHTHKMETFRKTHKQAK